MTKEQLEEIKLKIETDKILPWKAVKELYPNELPARILKELFSVYDIQELRSHSKN